MSSGTAVCLPCTDPSGAVCKLLMANLSKGSSRGRGSRAAAWFADHLDDKSETAMKSLVLEGGIKGWVAQKGEYLQYVQEYDESKW